MFHKAISILKQFLGYEAPESVQRPDPVVMAEAHASVSLPDQQHAEARDLATEASLSAATDASLAALVGLWQHDHEVHDTEHVSPRGLRHS